MRKLSKKIKQIIDEAFLEQSFEYTYENFLNDSLSQAKQFGNIKYLNSYFKKNLKNENDYLNFIVTKNSALVLTLHHYFEKSKKAIADYQKGSFSYKVLNDFWKIFVVISNNYIQMKQLFLNGFDFQGKVLFRNTIELTELCICMLGDEDFYNFLKKQTATGSDIIFQTVKFGTIKKTTNKIIKEIQNLPNNNLPQNTWDEYLAIRQVFYEDFSKYVHSNFINIMLSSHVPMIYSKRLDNKEKMILNLGGVVNNVSKTNIINLTVYDSISYMIILILLIEKHHLIFSKFDSNKNFLTVLSKLNWDLLPVILNSNKQS